MTLYLLLMLFGFQLLLLLLWWAGEPVGRHR